MEKKVIVTIGDTLSDVGDGFISYYPGNNVTVFVYNDGRIVVDPEDFEVEFRNPLPAKGKKGNSYKNARAKVLSVLRGDNK